MTIPVIPTPAELKTRIYNEDEQYHSFLKSLGDLMADNQRMREWLVLRDNKVCYIIDTPVTLSDFNRVLVSEHLKPLGWEIDFVNISINPMAENIQHLNFNRIYLRPLSPGGFRDMTLARG